MDNYSNYPAPSYEHCKKQIITKIYNLVRIQELVEKQLINLNDIVDQAFVLCDMLDTNNNIKCSLTGWGVMGYNDVFNKSLYIIDDINTKRKIKNKRLFRGLFKSTFLLIKNLKHTKDKMYEPDSDYMKEIYSKYN